MGLTDFLQTNGDNLREDVGVRSDGLEPIKHSPLEGRKQLDNAFRISLDRIESDPQHRREFDEEGLGLLAESMKQHGQLQPIRVRWDGDRGKYVVIAGERRFRAAGLAGLEAVDCTEAEEDLSESSILVQQVLENCQRKDLEPLERANAFKDLMDLNGWDGKRLAEELHLSPATVSNALRLLKLDDVTLARVESGELNAREAVETRRKKSKPAKQKPPRPRTYRTKNGRVVVEPKAGRTYLETLELAVEAEREKLEERKAA